MFNLIARRIDRNRVRATLNRTDDRQKRRESSGSGDRRFESFLASQHHNLLSSSSGEVALSRPVELDAPKPRRCRRGLDVLSSERLDRGGNPRG
jgi:hypothetical protein